MDLHCDCVSHHVCVHGLRCQNEVKSIKTMRWSDDVSASGAIKEGHEDRTNTIKVATFYQFPITVLCYGAARMVFSLWMWRFYLRTTLAMALLIVAFSVVYVLYLSPTTVTYFLAQSFPPHLNDEDSELGRRTLEENRRVKLP